MNTIIPSPALLHRCVQAIGRLQRGLAEVLDISDRTVSRYLGGEGAILTLPQGHALARAVFPRDPALAAEVPRWEAPPFERLASELPLPPRRHLHPHP